MLSLIVIEYNSADEVRDFISTAEKYLSDIDHEIIISSNSTYSDERQRELISSTHHARWLFNPANGGFAYGMNMGLKAAMGDTIAIANPDVKFRQSPSPMIAYLEEHREVGIIGPKIIDENGVIQDSFRHFFSPWGFFLRQIGWIKNRGKLHEKNYQTPVKGDWVIGAFMMLRRDFYEKVGGLSSDYFMYCEDTDWCKRAHLAGYDVVYHPGVVIEYKGTRSSRNHWKYTKIHIKSLLTFWRKYGF